MQAQISPEKRRELAAKHGVNEQYLYQCLTGRRDMSPAEAVRLERESKGVLTRRDLCQTTWQSVWPELAPKRKQKAARA